MAASRFNAPELRKPTGSPRPKGRENTKDTLCRNVLIYGHCRYEDQGCAFSHDSNRNVTAQMDSIKKSLNVDSPSFTPSTIIAPNKSTTPALTSQAANAAPFTPRLTSGLSSSAITPSPQSDTDATTYHVAASKEFTPQNYDITHSLGTNGTSVDSQAGYTAFGMESLSTALNTPQYNPYIEDPSAITNSATTYFPQQTAFSAPTQPLQYHLYSSVPPHKSDLLPHQKTSHGFFIPEDLRQNLQKKSEANLQVMANSQLPNVEKYHTLVALDTNHQRSATIFGYPAWVYKATSMKNGEAYCLRRIASYRLVNENAVGPIKTWRNVDSAGVVSVIEAFTTRAFGDSSLIFVTNYHPLAKTLVEVHLTGTNRYNRNTTISEEVIWSYIVQITSAMKAVHEANLAIRCMDPSKVIVTDKSRIRLNACSVLDVVSHENSRSISELQQEDFIHFGKLMLTLSTGNIAFMNAQNLRPAVEQMSRNYTPELRDFIIWLLTPIQPPAIRGVADLLDLISCHMVKSFDQSLHANDSLTSTLLHELENGRIARLMMKLGTINERPDFDSEKNWNENGERYMLKLFRDFVFHQVDGEGRPAVDMGHIIACLNKLDAGIEEKITLVSRDEQSMFVVSYRELNKQFAKAFSDLVAKGTPSKNRF